MSMLDELLRDIPMPPMVRIRQVFDESALEHPEEELRRELAKPGIMDQILPGQKVAVAVGSRGIKNIAMLTKTTIEAIQAAGAYPVIIPCIGSHGGATAEGQKDVLRHLGIDESTMGVPIHSSMEVVQIDELPNGLPIYVDKIAAESDAIIVINRVKPHTAFRGRIESGIMKMLVIGLGKQKGAETCHRLGFGYMAENVPAIAHRILAKLPVVFGVALVENAYDETCIVRALAGPTIESSEEHLLEEAKRRMPRLLFDQVDVLVVDYIGKNISGDGMDPNITGRYPTPYAFGGPDISKIVVLDLTPESNGNANGVGAADFTTSTLVDKMDPIATYANALTSTVCIPTKIPTTLENDLYAIRAAVKTCNILDFTKCRLVRIRDTLHLDEIEISVNLLDEALGHPDIQVVGEPYRLEFDENGNLAK